MPEHVPRPRNAFMFFRSAFNRNPSEYSTTVSYSDQNSVSCAAATVWNTYNDGQRAPFRQLAQDEKERYAKEYPGYRYANSGSGGVKKAKDRRRSSASSTSSTVRRMPKRDSIATAPQYPSRVSTRRASLAATQALTNASTSSPTPELSPTPESSQSGSASDSDSLATPPPRTPSPNPGALIKREPSPELDVHMDYVIGGEFTSLPPIDWDAELEYGSWSEASYPVKEEWDTYVDPFFPTTSLHSYDTFPELSVGTASEFSFFNEPAWDTEVGIKLEEN